MKALRKRFGLPTAQLLCMSVASNQRMRIVPETLPIEGAQVIR
jgi:hypothetical protein